MILLPENDVLTKKRGSLMKAMIFAAGLGTRLRPLTDNRPKALVQVGGIPLLEIAIRRLRKYGFREVVINVHHHADQIIQFLREHGYFGLNIHISDERDLLLNTGGGLKKAADFLSDAPFLVMNADVLTNMDFSRLVKDHSSSGALATLAVRNRESSRHLLFDQDRQLVGWRHNRTGELRMSRELPDDAYQGFAFSGIQIVDPQLFHYFPDEDVFSTIDLYLAAAKKEAILAYGHDADIWIDVGKLPAVQEAEGLLPFIDL